MREAFRWFGPSDLVRLNDIVQTGAREIVTSLHELPYGEAWPREAIERRQKDIEEGSAGLLRWSVVESLPVHENIKLGEGDLPRLFGNYRETLRNLAACGVTTVCYNFMPVLDWIRTDLDVPMPGGGRTLRFCHHRHAAFDCFILQREGAEDEYSGDVLDKAREWARNASDGEKRKLLDNIMAGLPGAFDRYDVVQLRRVLERYADIDAAALRQNIVRFLQEVIPTAEELGMRLCVHPDDPPRPVFGLPRIVSSREDIDFIVSRIPSPTNGVTLCAGSLGASSENDVPAIAEAFADRIHFAHLRNIEKDADGSFTESGQLHGDVDMVSVIAILLAEEERRRRSGRADGQIPIRPDHGHELLQDVGRPFHPGYSVVGRMKGLAELRGAAAAIAACGGLK